MQLSELKTGLKRYGFSDEDPLTLWLNASYLNWVLAAYPWSFTEADPVSLNVTAGQTRLILPADFSRLTTVKDMTTFYLLDQYERTRFEREIADPTATGKPKLYVATGFNGIDIWPVPDVATTIRVVYHSSRDELVNDTDVPEIPTELHYAIVQGAAAIALQAENEEQRAETAQDQFNQSVGRVWSRLAGPAAKDGTSAVRDVMGYGSSYGY